MKHCDIGLVGLAAMGRNLARNMDRNGFSVLAYNRTRAVTDQFLAGPGRDTKIAPAHDLRELAAGLRRPRRVLLMVKAGAPVDAVIHDLVPLLEPGDMILDCGNSLYTDSERRARELEARGLNFMGVGVSGGEEGALWGPSIMPGGPAEAYKAMEPLFRAVAAKAQGEPCVAHIGPGGAGHFVKMVHNGIEYGDMQLIAEAYDLMSRGLGMSAPEQAPVFEEWNRGVLASYLVEITSKVLAKLDPDTGMPLVDVILDVAGHKGTGRWTVDAALGLGVSAPTITSAVEARIVSGSRGERALAAGVLAGPVAAWKGDAAAFRNGLRDALYAAKICSYAQGFALMAAAGEEYGWDLDLGGMARIWRAGCIIRARFLDDVTAAFQERPRPANLLLAPFFTKALAERQASLRQAVATAVDMGLPVPALAASLSYYDAMRSARLPANLIQGQRDYFGAHTYRRVDREGIFHTDWSGDG